MRKKLDSFIKCVPAIIFLLAILSSCEVSDTTECVTCSYEQAGDQYEAERCGTKEETDSFKDEWMEYEVLYGVVVTCI